MKGLAAAVAAAAPQRVGTVTSVLGLGLEVAGLDCAVGELLTVGSGAEALDAEVVASVLGGVRCMPLGRLTGIAAGAPARASGRPVMVPTGAGLFGRVLDGMGRPLMARGRWTVHTLCRWTRKRRTPCSVRASTHPFRQGSGCWTP